MTGWVRLRYKAVSEIVGTEETGILLLVNEEETRQLTIPCDASALQQFRLRMNPGQTGNRLLPEVLWKIVSEQTDLQLEICIVGLRDGQYQAVIHNAQTFDQVPIAIADAVLLAHLSHIPIRITASLMMKQSVPYRPSSANVSIPVNALSDQMLARALERAVLDENYELASQLRDEQRRRPPLAATSSKE